MPRSGTRETTRSNVAEARPVSMPLIDAEDIVLVSAVLRAQSRRIHSRRLLEIANQMEQLKNSSTHDYSIVLHVQTPGAKRLRTPIEFLENGVRGFLAYAWLFKEIGEVAGVIASTTGIVILLDASTPFKYFYTVGAIAFLILLILAFRIWLRS